MGGEGLQDGQHGQDPAPHFVIMEQLALDGTLKKS